ncbi:ABC transporter ATP-binding protein [Hoeflea alexandrii]|uniref:ABC transporter ATP-binding protein n=1 Tax=Hoeflea alexandrii TaxID=288436 RepID=UPI0022AF1D96|nr:ABC transporter ATP-binding protein [Hoeflea alexandrii]MCZ4289644.1 ABC transporter ATP-binding protein [Hoeflea alexandrii]
MSALELSNIGLSFGGTPVLDDVSMHVAQGEFVSILGPSGCGKSSLLRLLTGALTPGRGEIRVGGAPLDGSPRAFAFMPQRDALMPWRRIIDNVILGLEIQGMGRAEARAKVRPLFATFGLDGFEHRYPAQLSGGMRQRAALMRTILQDRPVQLLDEPFGALDALTRAEMQRWLEHRWRDARWTTILVTHDVREAVALSDRIYVLSPRPARIIAEFEVPDRRPRLGRTLSPEAVRLEAELLDTLLTQTGDRS